MVKPKSTSKSCGVESDDGKISAVSPYSVLPYFRIAVRSRQIVCSIQDTELERKLPLNPFLFRPFFY
jgi:hypothetical protein